MLSISGLTFSFDGAKRVLKDFEMSVEEGELYTVLGRSGSGKSTLLNLIAGFLSPARGSIRLDGADITRVPPQKRRVGMVFQDLALFPHMTVMGNLTYGMGSTGKVRREDRAQELLSLVKLEGHEGRFPSELSGGERQRVALVRTLASDPRIVLLDEPLSSLDPSLRESLRRELRSLLKYLGTTAIYVTHDRTEALTVSDRIGLLESGSILEEGPPERMYWRPSYRRTARFMGMENIIEVRGIGDGHLDTDLGRIPWKGGRPRFLGFRPESIRTGGKGLALEGEVVLKEFTGREQQIEMLCEGKKFKALVPLGREVEKSGRIELTVPYEEIVPLR